jgi:NAD(P)-dependent dehydrogenase (short-subunit alcohol dehydrogenase family)
MPGRAQAAPVSGRRVLVTGANRGLGAAVAAAFRDHGDAVVALNRTPGALPGVHEVRGDVGRPVELATGVERALDHLGGLDVCVSNAAVRRLGWIGELALGDWHDSVAVNLSATFQLMGATLPALRQSRGHLVVVGSQAAAERFEGGAAYCATKAALEALLAVYRMETRAEGIRSTLLVPAAIRNRAGDESPAKLAPEDVAAVVLSLTCQPPGVLTSLVDVRPAGAEPGPVRGLARLQVY